jgi:NADH-quinone oxidoreductase subunit J
MSPQTILFWITSLLSVLSALGVVLHRNPVRSALFLVLNFVCLALLYFILHAQVLAVLQILVYAGAIMVLFLFVVMMLNLGGESGGGDPLVGQRLVGLLLGAALLSGLLWAINQRNWVGLGPDAGRVLAAEQQGISQIQIIGWDLFTKYVYPFELTSVLLLVGVMGTVLLSKRRRPGAEPASLSSDALS